MAVPQLSPVSETSAVALPATGALSRAMEAGSYAFGFYADTNNSTYYDVNFISGAVDQVAYTYKKLAGDVLDVELTDRNIYSAYEEAVLEYSYLVNIHQAKNAIGSALGTTTGSFDQYGNVSGSTTASEDDPHHFVEKNLALRFPKFDIGYARQVGDKTATEIGLGGTEMIYSASIETSGSQQDYDLQSIISSSATNSGIDFADKVGNNRILVRRVYFKTPHAMWRFYGYYGGLNSVGNLSTYGMYADDSTFDIVPAWQNKLQAMAYEDAIYTRNSHYSYEIKNNKLRIFPRPSTLLNRSIWIEFTVKQDPFEESGTDRRSGVEGVNNMNSLPFGNIPYKNINSIGKQWIRRYALAVSKEMLAHVRGKFGAIPIPGASVTLNASDLLNQAKEEKEKLREELKTVLDELTYSKISETQAGMTKNVNDLMNTIPQGIFVG